MTNATVSEIKSVLVHKNGAGIRILYTPDDTFVSVESIRNIVSWFNVDDEYVRNYALCPDLSDFFNLEKTVVNNQQCYKAVDAGAVFSARYEHAKDVLDAYESILNSPLFEQSKDSINKHYEIERECGNLRFAAWKIDNIAGWLKSVSEFQNECEIEQAGRTACIAAIDKFDWEVSFGQYENKTLDEMKAITAQLSEEAEKVSNDYDATWKSDAYSEKEASVLSARAWAFSNFKSLYQKFDDIDEILEQIAFMRDDLRRHGELKHWNFD